MTFQERHANYSRPIPKCGIYKITNKISGRFYIGKSNNIERRFSEHKSPNEWVRNPNKNMYLDMIRYGLNNFEFEIIEECSEKDLNERERYWIDKLDAYWGDLGYNGTEGGDGHSPGTGHPNHKLTENDIIDIRTRYNNHERRCEVEELYKDKISHGGFVKIWNGTNWSHIMPEVYTVENRNFHAHNTNRKGSANGRALVTEDQVRDIRNRKKNGEHWRDVYLDYAYTRIQVPAFKDIWNNRKWKHVIVE